MTTRDEFDPPLPLRVLTDHMRLAPQVTQYATRDDAHAENACSLTPHVETRRLNRYSRGTQVEMHSSGAESPTTNVDRHVKNPYADSTRAIRHSSNVS